LITLSAQQYSVLPIGGMIQW